MERDLKEKILQNFTSQMPHLLLLALLMLFSAIWPWKNISKIYCTRGVTVAMDCIGFFSFLMAVFLMARLGRRRDDSQQKKLEK